MKAGRTLFIGDMHSCRPEPVEALIDELEPDLTVFMGDYFDHFGDSLEATARMARWLAESLEVEDRIHLIGNHDLPYLTAGLIGCSGYTDGKASCIYRQLDRERWRERSHLFYWMEPGTLVTHAGISCSLLTQEDVPYERVRQWLTREVKPAWENLEDPDRSSLHPLWRVGKTRSLGWGTGPGGLLWCDWDHDFEPVPGLNQIIGHTPGHGIRIKTGPDGGLNICIDTCDPRGGGPRQVLLWQHGQYEIINLGDPYHA